MGQFTDVKWPAEYTELTKIEELLHCKICYEYIVTCVITPCSHNYCSICIRKFLNFKTQCPICFENIYEKDLHANRILDEFMESYLSLREKLFACIKGAKVEIENETPPAIFTPVKSNTKRNSRCFTDPPKKLFRDNKSCQSPCGTMFTTKESSLNTQLLKTLRKNSPGSSGSETITKSNQDLVLKIEQNIKNEINKKRVPCPVCSIEISETNINKHLDDCLKRQRSMSPPKTAKNSLEPIPKYVVNLMKDSQIRKLLKKYGLSTSGTRKTMEKRIQKFSTLYNSERDKLVPKSIEEIVRVCEEEEIAEKNLVKQNSSDNMLNIDRKTDLNVIEKAHKQYLERHKGDFQKLIDSINGRENSNKKKSATSRSLFPQEFAEDSVATTSSASQTTRQSFFNQSFENNDTNSSAADMSQNFIQDSDSTNTSYPLQHYSKDDPMRFLALEISSDSQQSPIKLEPSSPSRTQASMTCKIKSDTSQGFENDLDMITLSNPSLDNPVSSISEQGGTNLLNNDLFDASTEDNWSDSYPVKSRPKKSKKLLMKRSLKVELDYLSTDSDTDVETKSFGYLGRKTTKIKKEGENGVEVKAVNDHGLLAESPADFKAGIYKPFNLRNKENSDIADVSKTATVARRSSRKRKQVSYAVNLKGKKKTLDEVQQNFTKNDDRHEEATLGNGAVEIEKKEKKEKKNKKENKEEGVDSIDQTVNDTSKSLRKRRKR